MLNYLCITSIYKLYLVLHINHTNIDKKKDHSI